MGNAAHPARRAAQLPFDDSEVNCSGLIGVRHNLGRHGPANPTAPVAAAALDVAALGAAFGPAGTTGAPVMTGADAAGGEISALAKVGLGVGDGFGGGTCAATCTDDHSRPYQGCDASACAAAADADATGVGDSVTYGTCPGNT